MKSSFCLPGSPVWPVAPNALNALNPAWDARMLPHPADCLEPGQGNHTCQTKKISLFRCNCLFAQKHSLGAATKTHIPVILDSGMRHRRIGNRCRKRQPCRIVAVHLQACHVSCLVPGTTWKLLYIRYRLRISHICSSNKILTTHLTQYKINIDKIEFEKNLSIKLYNGNVN